MTTLAITTGQTTMDLRWARANGWMVVAYAQGGYCVQRYIKGIGWVLANDHDPCPVEVERALCEALGIACEE